MKIKKIGVLLFLFTLFACSSSHVTHVWKANEPAKQSYHKILVLGLIPDKDRRIQENMETHVAGDLTDLGYRAVTSIQEFGPKAFEKMDEKTALNKLKNSGIDAVITIVLLDKRKEHKYIPPHLSAGANGTLNNFWEYRLGLYNRILEPGYYVTDTEFFWESNFFELNNQKLIYSIQTKSFDPKSSWSMGHEYGHVITSKMLKQHILHKQEFPDLN